CTGRRAAGGTRSVPSGGGRTPGRSGHFCVSARPIGCTVSQARFDCDKVVHLGCPC
ncbi:MAG: hypothetical protein AVDCRST_MAG41-3877, partial [uncultured Corynebacteriales bacterium]